MQFGMHATGIVGRKTLEERADRKRLPVWKDLRVTTASDRRENRPSLRRLKDSIKET